MIITCLFFVYLSYYIMNFFQQAHYHLNSFFDLVKKIIKDWINYLLLISIIGLFEINDYIIMITITIVFGIYIFFKIKRNIILRLRITHRIIRLFVTSMIMMIIGSYYLNCFMMLFSPIVIYFSSIILIPLEYLIGSFYIHKAKRTINRINPLVIGITGSAGKTSTKSILYQILSKEYNTFVTPKSYNTVLGISKAINEGMNDFIEIAIIEYGASKINDISKSLKVVKCDISIITNIFEQHLETFKSVDNIIKEKTKIIEGSKLHVGNSLHSYNVSDGLKCLWVGGVDSDYFASDISYEIGHMKFMVWENKKCYPFVINLLGVHNVYNSLISIAVLRYLGYEMKKIGNLFKSVVPEKNRLEELRINGKYIINDSFNSNKNGFLEALNVLKIYPGSLGIITPGIVSGGYLIQEINEEVAIKISSICEVIYIVRSVVSDYMKRIFEVLGKEYKEVDSFLEGYEELMENERVKTILIENDITDFYAR